jgi:Delta3-Delta2-enoyl-CoA isomerase
MRVGFEREKTIAFQSIDQMIGVQRRLMSSVLTQSVDNGTIEKITLNRPSKYNAISVPMYSRWIEALDAASNSPASSVTVLSGGTGKFYCSGNDLANFSQLKSPKTMAAEGKQLLYDFVDAFIRHRKPIVVAVNGPAIGVAVTTLALCDEVYSGASATFHTPFKSLGQTPEGCSSYTFARLMGDVDARRVLDDGVKLSADEAKRVGLVRDVVDGDADALDAFVMQRARAIRDSDEAPRRNLVDNEPGMRDTLRAVNRQECDTIEAAWLSPECFNAIADFLQSRNATVPALAMRTVNRLRFLWA